MAHRFFQVRGLAQLSGRADYGCRAVPWPVCMLSSMGFEEFQMPHELILLPMGALALLTFAVLLLIPIRRFRAAFAGQVGAGDFRYGESPRVPGEVSIPNRNYMNLLELPILFYVVCVLNYVAGPTVSVATLALAWIYVAFRTLHSLVHLTYNDVMHRLAMFVASNVALAILWIAFFAHLLRGNS